LITILFDGIEANGPFLPILKKLSNNLSAIINVPSFDFETEFNIHVSPSLSLLLKKLTPRRRWVGGGYRLSSMLRKLNLADVNVSDFDLMISILLTIWLKSELSLVDFYHKISESLGIRYRILPLLSPLPCLTIEMESGTEINPIQFMEKGYTEKIKKLKYCNLEKAKIIDETKEVLEDSDIILLFQVAPVTMYFLKSIGSLKKTIENFKGTIIYFLPETLKDMDRKFLSLSGYDENLYGLIKMAHEQVDAIIFDERNQDLITNLTDVKVTFYPIPYEFGSRNGLKNFIENILKVLQQ